MISVRGSGQIVSWTLYRTRLAAAASGMTSLGHKIVRSVAVATPWQLDRSLMTHNNGVETSVEFFRLFPLVICYFCRKFFCARVSLCRPASKSTLTEPSCPLALRQPSDNQLLWRLCRRSRRNLSLVPHFLNFHLGDYYRLGAQNKL